MSISIHSVPLWPSQDEHGTLSAPMVNKHSCSDTAFQGFKQDINELTRATRGHLGQPNLDHAPYLAQDHGLRQDKLGYINRVTFKPTEET